jgi:hypothetical protein
LSKNLIYSELKVNGPDGSAMSTWQLLPFGPNPLMHAMWHPVLKALICQYDSIKENLVELPKPSAKVANKKPQMQERKVQQYYTINITDVGAIQAILDNFVVNYNGQDWQVEYDSGKTDVLSTPEKELENV